MVNSFLDFLKTEKRYSPHTIVSYRTDLDQFQSYLMQTYEESDIANGNHRMIRSWILSMMENGMEAKSVNRKLAALRTFYKFLLRNKKIEINPMLKITAPKVRKKLPVFVEEVNMLKLLDQFEFEDGFSGLRDRLVLELFYGTGMRLSELIDLKDEDIRFKEGVVKVRGKGNKERIIPIPQSVLAIAEKYAKEKTKLNLCNTGLNFVVTDNGDQVYPVFIYRLVKKYLGYVSTIEKKSPHVLRHTFATHLLNKGADLNAIKDLLGHSSLAATQVYTHNSMDQLKKIFDQAHPKS
ncbi:MAG TPA: tyrosine-type recombinase/integrase [Cytophagaceae bacterium]|jgi:integrase/recombinase XerC|nr:tyrosine-type recombinase/integrase [Cytophagaceae bacterium]